MLKLLKYEFRKNLTGILVMLGITAALEGYFLYGVYIKPEDMWHAAIAGGLLFGMTFAVSVFVCFTICGVCGVINQNATFFLL